MHSLLKCLEPVVYEERSYSTYICERRFVYFTVIPTVSCLAWNVLELRSRRCCGLVRKAYLGPLRRVFRGGMGCNLCRAQTRLMYAQIRPAPFKCFDRSMGWACICHQNPNLCYPRIKMTTFIPSPSSPYCSSRSNPLARQSYCTYRPLKESGDGEATDAVEAEANQLCKRGCGLRLHSHVWKASLWPRLPASLALSCMEDFAQRLKAFDYKG